MSFREFKELEQAERDLPSLLQNLDGWQSLDVDYHPPRVERLWRPYGDDMRLFLHCIHPCSREEALLHPHPWRSWVTVHSGTYLMLVGSNAGTEPPPVVCESVVRVTPGTVYRYAMHHPDGWHAVVPIGRRSYSVMLTDKPWNRPIPAVTEETKGKLQPLPRERELELLDRFRSFYPMPA